MWQLAYLSTERDGKPSPAIGAEPANGIDPLDGVGQPGISAARMDGLDLPWLPKDPPARPKAIEQIGRAILQLRLYLGWRQLDVEARARVDQTTISRLEHGIQKGLSLRKLAAVLDALMVGEIQMKPWVPSGPATDLERMLHGDPWRRATERADLRLRRPKRTRTTISTRSSSESNPGGMATPQEE
jgi:transcriptional regulator with XRE-family HTH domain